jgi:hypothetical protein
MLKFIYIIWLIFLKLIYSQSSYEYYKILNEINSDSIKNHTIFLASDELEGRGLGSKGIQLAANYLADKFSEYNLLKIPGKNTYFQEIPMHASLPLESSELVIIQNKNSIKLNYGKDYYLFKSGQQTFIPQPLEIIFVGYGIIAPEYDYNDYQSIDIEGKIAIYFDSEPISSDENYFNGNKPTQYSLPEVKRRIAITRGAAGTILIPIERYTNWKDVQRDFEQENVSLAFDVSSNLSLIINPNIVNLLFANSNYSFDDILNMHFENKIKSFSLNSKIKFKGVFKERNFIEKNVLGIKRGTDKKLSESIIIISAHYDHLGIGKSISGDSIYNGALDNAIGVAVMLELARTLSKLNLKRTILFIATTGEEKGLLGSIYYCENPVFPLYKSVANLNIDGIAFFRDFSSLIAVGKEFSNLGDFVKQSAQRFNLKVENIPEFLLDFGAFNNSDHYAFANYGIPSIIVLEGLDNKTLNREEVKNEFIDYFLNRYHTPFDDLNQNIDFVAAEKHAKVLFDLIYRLANSNEEIKWNNNSPFLKYYLRNLAEKK